ncbi:peptidylprolyl isomerase, partial [Candidatus Woesebacteria bacterium]|nr:peptidylprolyl isomerase [Candidatus Woesebacteria bacterium]
HRIMKGFMIQGGDPKGDGTGGSGYTVPSEINADLKHERGAISMARLPDNVNPKKESSGSQFFIMHKTTAQLDGQYTIFGKVTSGMDIVDKIAEKEVKESASGEMSKPVDPVKVENIKITED